MITAEMFDLSGRVMVVTGGAGLLGLSHAAAIASAGGVPILADLAPSSPDHVEHVLGFRPDYVGADITREDEVGCVSCRQFSRATVVSTAS